MISKLGQCIKYYEIIGKNKKELSMRLFSKQNKEIVQLELVHQRAVVEI
jgi:hypothetical protein